MTRIATILGYHGPVTGFATAIIDPTQGAYIEFERRDSDKRCLIHYKRHEKMAHATDFLRAQAAKPVGKGSFDTWDTRAGQWIPTRRLTLSGGLGGGGHENAYAQLFLSGHDVQRLAKRAEKRSGGARTSSVTAMGR